jgi:hypothetical protein
MSLDFFRHWATKDVFNACQGEWQADIGVLRFGKTFMGFRYRAANDETIVVISPHMPKRVKNIVTSLRDNHIRVVSRTVKQLNELCKRYRAWSFSIVDRGTGDYPVDQHVFRLYLGWMGRNNLPMPYPWQHSSKDLEFYVNSYNRRPYAVKPENPARFEELYTCHLDMLAYQLVRIGLLEDILRRVDTDPYAVSYARGTAYLAKAICNVETYASREQMVASQLAGDGDRRFLILAER